MTDLTMSQFASKDDLLAAQSARIAELESQLEAIGAGGVEPLRKPAAPQAVQAAVPEGWKLAPIKPTPEMCHVGRYGGDKDAPAYGEKSVEGATAWPFVADHTAEQIYQSMLAAAPAHPAEGVPAQPRKPLRDLALGVTSFLDHAGMDTSRLPAGMGAALRRLRDAAIATQPAAQGMDAQLAKLTTAYKELSSMFHDQVVAQQAAWIEWKHGNGAEDAMQWIENGLCGPGHIPDEDEPYGKEAQAWFDANKSDPIPVCACGRPSNSFWMGHGFCSEAHFDEFRAAQAKQGGA